MSDLPSPSRHLRTIGVLLVLLALVLGALKDLICTLLVK